MKLITRSNLRNYNKNELRALFKATYDELMKSDKDSFERRNGLASLENIQREIAERFTRYVGVKY